MKSQTARAAAEWNVRTRSSVFNWVLLGVNRPLGRNHAASHSVDSALTPRNTQAGAWQAWFAYAVPVPSIGISVLQGFHIDGFQLVQLRLPAFGLRGRARATAAAEEELEGGVRLSGCSWVVL